MTSRVTRSSARLAANPSATTDDSTPPITDSSTRQTQSTRKRKATQGRTSSSSPETTESAPARKSKKPRLSESAPVAAQQPQDQATHTSSRATRRGKRASLAMSGSAYEDADTSRPSGPARRRHSPTHSDDVSHASSAPRHRSGHRKNPPYQTSPPSASSKKAFIQTPPRKTLESSSTMQSADNPYHLEDDARHRSDDEGEAEEKVKDDSDGERGHEHSRDEDEDNDEDEDEDDDDETHEDGNSDERSTTHERGDGSTSRRFLEDQDGDNDPFSAGFLGRSGMPSGLSNTLRALSGMMSGMTTRLRGILSNLRAKDDPTVQMIGLTELSEILLVSNEDNLAGHFSPDQYVKELVTLMQPSDFGEENPEMMLLACRCIANLMEALPAATASVVYGGAVPVLCQKLLEIHYIDVAEQALSTLEKISVEFPSSIVREGGLTACLTYLDFFATSTQRTAVTTAANCCRNIPEDSFPVVRDVMPVLLNVLGSSDQKVVEQGSLCVSRIIESFRYKEDKLEELVSPELLQAMLRLLLPGTTNLIGPNIHTQFLRVLAITARASPRLAIELLRMNVVDTLYQILTGVSPPEGVEDIATKIDKNIIMQALIRSPRDQIFETLNVICEILPAVSRENLMFLDQLTDAGYTGAGSVSMATRARKSPNEKRLELLQDCQADVKRFAVILFPTLMHAYTSTVNLSVRQKVLTAQLKMLSNFDTSILENALSGVTYASHLASILTQQENTTLVTFALQIAELLLKRLEHIYRPQFYREGVMAEIMKLAQRPLNESLDQGGVNENTESATANLPERGQQKHQDSSDDEHEADEPDYPDEESEGDMHDGGAGHHEDDDIEDDDEDSDDGSSPEGRSRPADRTPATNGQDIITTRAKKFMEVYSSATESGMQLQASAVLEQLRDLASQLSRSYTTGAPKDGQELFARLAKYFNTDALETITSYELLTSGVVEALLTIFTSNDPLVSMKARSEFVEAFMSSNEKAKAMSGSSASPGTAFSVLIYKLQDLLSRTEHFEVFTISHNAFDSSRSSAASMLAKQLRIKLVADETSGIPRPYRNIMVSIHAIATFRALDDYLRPRISLAERAARSRDALTNTLARASAATPSATPENATTKTRPSSADSKTTPGQPGKESSNRLRRSSRNVSAQRGSNDEEAPRTPTASRADPEHSNLECADEATFTDEDEEDRDAALDAIVDDLDHSLDDEDIPDPSAVNLQVANTGRVTAHREDGTRVSTPQQGSQPLATSRLSAAASLAAARELLSTPTSSARPSAQAAPPAPISQDWHIEFSIDDQPLANDTTIYRAVHFNQSHPEEVSSRNVWSNLHKISFKRLPGPPPAETSFLSSSTEFLSSDGSSLPPSLSEHPITASILRLMSILHQTNVHLEDVLVDKGTLDLDAEPLSAFVNTKLTAKLNRQLEEPLIVASNCLPTWSEDLARLYPFLFPFETRHLFLQSTSFGYSRSMTRWQNSQAENESRRHRDERPFLGRLQRQKVRISRSRILESAIKVMELYGSSPSILEVEYFEEVGTGLGPTLEFYSTVSKEFSKKKIKLWRENESQEGDEFAFGASGLFPAPMSVEQAATENGKRIIHLFRMLGKFVARSMLDSRIIDVSFNPTFFRVGDADSTVTPSLGAVASVDKDLANSLKHLMLYVKAKRAIDEDAQLTPMQKVQASHEVRIKDVAVEDMGLDLTLPGYPSIELQPSGSSIDVTIDNVELYVSKVIDFTLRSGVQKQVEAFRAGFSQVFPYSALKAFTPDELVMLFGRSEEDWSLETLMDSIKADHGFNLDSASVRNLLQVMSEYTAAQQRDFLQFVTGSPKLPIGGFKSLTPMFTVVCKPSEPPLTSDDYLPSVMTCVNYLKMPNYSSIEVLREKLGVAIREGQGAFHLS
ncbi:hypothetical protein AAFC00_006361 [Neodothiora populina]|uniref:HECT-type E3 ubiquitin transferase n=1 Tax=Neodothiora populina TaxID=2781224 RepID=A0ABR3P540_9PEZI